jgi:hypothetical protein
VVDSGNAANLITSDDVGGVLRVKLNWTGRQGMPSEDPIQCVGYDSSNRQLFSRVEGVGKGVKSVAISFKRPPGAQCSEGPSGAGR